MNEAEGKLIISQLRRLFGGHPQPAWDGPGVTATWLDLLKPFTLLDGNAAVESLVERAEARLNAVPPKEVYFPSPLEFGNFLRKVATQRERESTTAAALTASIRCDGSRWIDNAPDADGERPWPNLGPGVVPCPTCNPANHSAVLAGEGNDRLDTKGVAKPPPACKRPGDFMGGRDHQRRWGTAVAAYSRLPLRQRILRLPEPDDGGNLVRLEAFVTTIGAPKPETRRVTVGVAHRLGEEPVDATPHPEDSARKCPWCGASVHRTRVEDWWLCAEGHTSSTGQVDAGRGGGR